MRQYHLLLLGITLTVFGFYFLRALIVQQSTSINEEKKERSTSVLEKFETVECETDNQDKHVFSRQQVGDELARVAAENANAASFLNRTAKPFFKENFNKFEL